jgi:hypothetical protein
VDQCDGVDVRDPAKRMYRSDGGEWVPGFDWAWRVGDRGWNERSGQGISCRCDPYPDDAACSGGRARKPIYVVASAVVTSTAGGSVANAAGVEDEETIGDAAICAGVFDVGGAGAGVCDALDDASWVKLRATVGLQEWPW